MDNSPALQQQHSNAPGLAQKWRAWEEIQRKRGELENLTVDELIAQLDERDRGLFACDCAERVLPIYEAAYSDDPRLRNAIAVARRADATNEELFGAQDDASDANIEAAHARPKTSPVRDATWAAAKAARAAALAVVYADAHRAAEEAARATSAYSRVGAFFTELNWQRRRLIELILAARNHDHE